MGDTPAAAFQLECAFQRVFGKVNTTMDGQSRLQELALRSLGFKARGRHPNDYTNHPIRRFYQPAR